MLKNTIKNKFTSKKIINPLYFLMILSISLFAYNCFNPSSGADDDDDDDDLTTNLPSQSTQGGKPTDQGGKPTDQGGKPTDQGGKPTDQGGKPTDQGGKPTDQGGKPTDQGGKPTDQGGKPTDQGGRPTDQGGRPTDQGGKPTDQGGKPTIQVSSSEKIDPKKEELTEKREDLEDLIDIHKNDDITIKINGKDTPIDQIDPSKYGINDLKNLKDNIENAAQRLGKTGNEQKKIARNAKKNLKKQIKKFFSIPGYNELHYIDESNNKESNTIRQSYLGASPDKLKEYHAFLIDKEIKRQNIISEINYHKTEKGENDIGRIIDPNKRLELKNLNDNEIKKLTDDELKKILNHLNKIDFKPLPDHKYKSEINKMISTKYQTFANIEYNGKAIIKYLPFDLDIINLSAIYKKLLPLAQTRDQLYDKLKIDKINEYKDTDFKDEIGKTKLLLNDLDKYDNDKLSNVLKKMENIKTSIISEIKEIKSFLGNTNDLKLGKAIHPYNVNSLVKDIDLNKMKIEDLKDILKITKEEKERIEKIAKIKDVVKDNKLIPLPEASKLSSTLNHEVTSKSIDTIFKLVDKNSTTFEDRTKCPLSDIKAIYEKVSNINIQKTFKIIGKIENFINSVKPYTDSQYNNTKVGSKFANSSGGTFQANDKIKKIKIPDLKTLKLNQLEFLEEQIDKQGRILKNPYDRVLSIIGNCDGTKKQFIEHSFQDKKGNNDYKIELVNNLAHSIKKSDGTPLERYDEDRINASIDNIIKEYNKRNKISEEIIETYNKVKDLRSFKPLIKELFGKKPLKKLIKNEKIEVSDLVLLYDKKNKRYLDSNKLEHIKNELNKEYQSTRVVDENKLNNFYDSTFKNLIKETKYQNRIAKKINDKYKKDFKGNNILKNKNDIAGLKAITKERLREIRFNKGKNSSIDDFIKDMNYIKKSATAQGSLLDNIEKIKGSISSIKTCYKNILAKGMNTDIIKEELENEFIKTYLTSTDYYIDPATKINKKDGYIRIRLDNVENSNFEMKFTNIFEKFYSKEKDNPDKGVINRITVDDFKHKFDKLKTLSKRKKKPKAGDYKKVDNNFNIKSKIKDNHKSGILIEKLVIVFDMLDKLCKMRINIEENIIAIQKILNVDIKTEATNISKTNSKDYFTKPSRKPFEEKIDVKYLLPIDNFKYDSKINKAYLFDFTGMNEITKKNDKLNPDPIANKPATHPKGYTTKGSRAFFLKYETLTVNFFKLKSDDVLAEIGRIYKSIAVNPTLQKNHNFCEQRLKALTGFNKVLEKFKKNAENLKEQLKDIK